MSSIVTDDISGQSTEATGHPTECTEPVPGTVQGTTHNVKINNANGDVSPIATEQSTLHFDSHSHTFDGTCTNNQSHDLSNADFDSAKFSSSLNINGEAVMVVANDVSTDPVTNSPVNVVGSGINNSLSET